MRTISLWQSFVALVLSTLTLLCLPEKGQGGTICVKNLQSCTGTRSCRASVFVPSMNTSFQIEAAGPALALIPVLDGVEQFQMTWVQSEFTGSHPVLGNIDIHLSSAALSTGIVTSLTPNSWDYFFPALNTNSFFFEFNFSAVGTTLLSAGPVGIQAVINSIPPDGTVFNLVSPVDLYAQGDVSQTPIAILTSAEVHFTAAGPPIRFISPWGAPEPSTCHLLFTVLLCFLAVTLRRSPRLLRVRV